MKIELSSAEVQEIILEYVNEIVYIGTGRRFNRAEMTQSYTPTPVSRWIVFQDEAKVESSDE